jgi:hypothetical protein
VPSLTHCMLAEYVGTSREIVTFQMNRLRKLGLLAEKPLSGGPAREFACRDPRNPGAYDETRAGTSRNGDDCAGVDHHTAPGC